MWILGSSPKGRPNWRFVQDLNLFILENFHFLNLGVGE